MFGAMSSEQQPDCLHYPATARNREPILEVLRRVLPATGRVVEVGSGSGEHGVFFAEHLPGIVWAPSDPSPEARRSVDAWARASGLANIEPAQALDATWDEWPWEQSGAQDRARKVAAIAAINVIHISPWATCLGLLAGAKRLLKPGGVLFLYGPYRRGGRHTAPSNATFDASLRRRDPTWGVRNLEDVQAAAGEAGLTLQEVVEMPANNLSVVFSKTK